MNKYRSVSLWVRDLEMERVARAQEEEGVQLPPAYYLTDGEMSRLRFIRWLLQEGRISK